MPKSTADKYNDRLDFLEVMMLKWKSNSYMYPKYKAWCIKNTDNVTGSRAQFFEDKKDVLGRNHENDTMTNSSLDIRRSWVKAQFNSLISELIEKGQPQSVINALISVGKIDSVFEEKKQVEHNTVNYNLIMVKPEIEKINDPNFIETIIVKEEKPKLISGQDE